MSPNIKKLVSKGERIYRQRILRSKAARRKGDYAAIEVKSERYFVGKTPLKALEKGEIVFPKAKFHLVRIGYPAASCLKKKCLS